MSQLLLHSWFTRNHPLTFLLLPLAWLFSAIVRTRRVLYRRGVIDSHDSQLPVIVVGNLTVGGAGKTPFVIWLVSQLRAAGYNPAVISRGYGGESEHYPVAVLDNNNPDVVGDEPVMMARRCLCPVIVSPKRVDAINFVETHTDCDVIVSDDGLQHYAMARNIEIAVVDTRRFGNGQLMPAGPLREPAKRIESVDFVVARGNPMVGEFSYRLKNTGFVNVLDQRCFDRLPGGLNQTIHAVAGIGNPPQFFEQLQALGFEVIEHPFPDHHRYAADDIRFDDDKLVVMTEKDAVKCRPFASPTCWYLKVDAEIDVQLAQQIITKLKGSSRG